MAAASLLIMTEDTTALVNDDPRKVRDRTPIHQTSYHLHRDMPPWARRQILALDAARFGDRTLSTRILATPVPGEPDAEWTVDWSTGAQVDPRLRATIPVGRHSVEAATPITIDGRPHIVSGDQGGTAFLWDATTGERVGGPMRCGDEETWVEAVATLEIDGRPHAVTAGTDEFVRVWDLTTRKKVATYESPFRWVKSLAAIAAGGRAYAVASYTNDGATNEGLIRCWGLPTGATPDCPDDEELAAVAAVVIDGRPHAVAGFRDGALLVWDMATGAPTCQRPRGHDTAVNTVTPVVIDGRPHAITTARDGTAFLWDLTTGEQVGAPLLDPSERASRIAAVDLDGRPHALVLRRDNTLALLDLDTRREVIERLSLNPAESVAAAVIDGRPHAVAGHSDGTVRIWELRPLPPDDRRIPGHQRMIKSMATVDLDGRPHIVSGDFAGNVRTWDPVTGAPGATLKTDGLSADVARATFRLDGRPHAVITQGSSGTAAVWDLVNGTRVGDPFTIRSGHRIIVNALATVTIDSRPHAALCTFNGELHLWDLAARQWVGEPWSSDEYWREAAPVEIDGRPHLIIAVRGGALRLWDLTTCGPVGDPLTGHDESVSAITTTTVDGRPHAITGSSDRTVRLWDLAAGVQVGDPITAHEWEVNAVAVGTLGGRRVIATGGDDHAVRLWDLATREQVGRDLNFTWKVFGVEILPDDRIAVAFGQEVAVLTRTA